MNRERYYTNEREEILPFVPPGVRRTLDIGCGAGRFSGMLRQRFGCETWGVEINGTAAAAAQEIMDHVLHASAEEALDKLPADAFDCIFCNDILEHLPQPELLLQRLQPLLKENGCVIASLPNVRFLPHLKELLIDRDWQYTDSGILDRTHLRFFTRKSMERMFRDCGYDIWRIAGINRIKSLKYRLLAAMLPGFSDTVYLQFLVTAGKKKAAII